jgi:hypothetical protein
MKRSKSTMAKNDMTATVSAPKETKVYVILQEGADAAAVKASIASVTTSDRGLVAMVTGENPRAVLTFKIVSNGTPRGPRKPKA